MRAPVLLLLGLVACSLLAPAAALGATPSIEPLVSADTVEEGKTFTYSVTASARGRTDIALASTIDFGPFAVVGQQQIPQYITINGISERRLTLSFSLRPTKQGKFEIEGPEFVVGGERIDTRPVTVTVVAPGKAPRPSVDSKSGYFIETTVQPERDPWVGEQILLSYDLYVDATQVDTVARQMDEPPLDDFWIEDLSERTAGGSRVSSVNGRLMERKAMRTYALFPLHAGPVTIEPMEIELVVGNFFRRGREFRVASKPVELDVRPLPPDAPESFYDGNVGTWAFRVSSDQSVTRVGRAVRVELTITGDGQLGRLEVPALPQIPGARLSKPEIDTTPRVRDLVVGGTRTAVYTVTPLAQGTLTIPAIEFSSFDPKAGKYVTTRSEPLTIRVAAGSLPPEPVAETDLTRRTLAGGGEMVENLRDTLRDPRLSISLAAHPDPARFGWWWWLLGGTSLAIFVAVLVAPRARNIAARRAPERARNAAAREILARFDDAGTDPDAIVKAIRDYLHELHDVPRGVVTAGDIRSAFARAGLPESVAEELADVLEQCERARYAPSGGVDAGVSSRARDALRGMPARTARPTGRSASAAVVLLAFATVASLAAMSELVAGPTDLEAATQALEKAQWAEAMGPLQRLAAEHPRAVDVMYDLGTAAAHAEEHGLARWALERAAWLAPHDADVKHNREVVARIVRLDAIEVSRTGRTMNGDEALFWWRMASAIPPWAYGLAMCLGWLAAAGLLFLRRRDERPAVRDGAFIGASLAVCLGVFAVFGTVARASLIDSTEPVVVMGELELREGPNPAAATKRTPASMVPGTLLRVTDRRGEWVKLTWSGDSGWTHSETLRPIR